MAGEDFARLLTEALLGVHLGILDYATASTAHALVVDATLVQEKKQEKESGNELCPWIGVAVSPMTPAFADAIGMAEPYGAVFDHPEAGSPAANAGIEAGDVITAINDSPLMRSSDFAAIISSMAPGTTVYLTTWRGGEWFQRKLILGSSKCPDPTGRLRTNNTSADPYNWYLADTDTEQSK
jgi:membrane-associated protease RseP (regulator of RpoE activity)